MNNRLHFKYEYVWMCECNLKWLTFLVVDLAFLLASIVRSHGKETLNISQKGFGRWQTSGTAVASMVMVDNVIVASIRRCWRSWTTTGLGWSGRGSNGSSSSITACSYCCCSCGKSWIIDCLAVAGCRCSWTTGSIGIGLSLSACRMGYVWMVTFDIAEIYRIVLLIVINV